MFSVQTGDSGQFFLVCEELVLEGAVLLVFGQEGGRWNTSNTITVLLYLFAGGGDDVTILAGEA